MNNTDLQVRFSKETEQQVLHTGEKMNLYYTDEYVRWLEAKVLQQANGVQASEATAISPLVNTCAKKIQVAEKALADIIKCEQGHEDFTYEDTIEIANRAQEQIMKIDGF